MESLWWRVVQDLPGLESLRAALWLHTWPQGGSTGAAVISKASSNHRSVWSVNVLRSSFQVPLPCKPRPTFYTVLLSVLPAGFHKWLRMAMGFPMSWGAAGTRDARAMLESPGMNILWYFLIFYNFLNIFLFKHKAVICSSHVFSIFWADCLSLVLLAGLKRSFW